MESVFIDDELGKVGLPSIIDLSVLRPDSSLYDVLVIQPSNDIVADEGIHSVRNKDAPSSSSRYRSFLELAASKNVDLAVAPEYSCPWPVLEERIAGAQLPTDRKLWVLGCESITPAELDALAARHAGVKWIYEPDIANGTGCFLNPVCFVFWARDGAQTEHPVVAVQFKGQHMADQGLVNFHNSRAVA